VGSINLDETLPLNAGDLTWLAGKETRLLDSLANSTGREVCIKLFVIGITPGLPIRKAARHYGE
jgi:hypothetical protein